MIRFAPTHQVLLGIALLAITMAAAEDSTFADMPQVRSQPSPAGLRNTGFGPFTIKVEIEGVTQGVTQGVFSSLEGLVSASEVMPSQNGVREQSPGPVKSAHLILRRPYDPLLSGLWHWRQASIDGVPMRRDGHIFIFNSGGQLVAHWVFHAGWPCRWEVPALVAGTSAPAEEVIEIVHTGLSLEPPSGS